MTKIYAMEVTRSCGYCYASSEDLKLCQIRSSPKDKQWQHPKWLCKSCRNYLRGLFRYSPVSIDEYRLQNSYK